MGTAGIAVHCEPWNKRKIVGLKAPFMLQRPRRAARVAANQGSVTAAMARIGYH